MKRTILALLRANCSGGWAVAWDQPGQPGKDASGFECERCGRSRISADHLETLIRSLRIVEPLR